MPDSKPPAVSAVARKWLTEARAAYLAEQAAPTQGKRFYCVVQCECPQCDGKSVSRVEN